MGTALVRRLQRQPLGFFLVMIVALCLGAARYRGAQTALPPGFIAWYNDTGQEMVLVGEVAAPPDTRDTYTNLRVQMAQVRAADSLHHTDVSGLALVRVLPGETWAYGDRLVVRGVLETPAEVEDFSYREYLARQGVYTIVPEGRAARLDGVGGRTLLRGLFAVKARALEVVYRLYPDPEASLLAGILLGVETGIPKPVQEAFKDTGTSWPLSGVGRRRSTGGPGSGAPGCRPRLGVGPFPGPAAHWVGF
jgi:competence protein ComEC